MANKTSSCNTFVNFGQNTLVTPKGLPPPMHTLTTTCKRIQSEDAGHVTVQPTHMSGRLDAITAKEMEDCSGSCAANQPS